MGVRDRLLFAAFLALAIATEDQCSGLFTPTRFLAAIAAAGFIGALVGTLLHGRFEGRPRIPWVAGIAAATFVFVVLFILLVMNFGAECSR